MGDPIENIDKFGNCCFCHKNLIRNVVLNGKVEGTWCADKDEAYMKLNNGSIMPISICRPCKDSIDLNDPEVQAQIMESVQNGWTLELHQIQKTPELSKHFTQQKIDDLKTFYSDLEIVGYDENHKVGVS